MTSQSGSAVFTSKDNSELHIPCGCGNPTDFINIWDSRDKPEDEFDDMYLSVYLSQGDRLIHRIKTAWRILIDKPQHDSVLLSKATVKDMIDWLGEKIADAPKTNPNTSHVVTKTLISYNGEEVTWSDGTKDYVGPDFVNSLPYYDQSIEAR